MKIGELSRATGTNIETIRYYERIGLLPEPDRTAANYRSYGDAHRARLAFVRHSRDLGFTIEEVRSLLDLSNRSRKRLPSLRCYATSLRASSGAAGAASPPIAASSRR
jgi:DNA-binding transcriptional MerR regulator